MIACVTALVLLSAVTGVPKMWELGLNYQNISEAEMTALVQYKWPLLTCPEQFAHAQKDVSLAHASQAFDKSQTTPCDPSVKGPPAGNPAPCLDNKVCLATACADGALLSGPYISSAVCLLLSAPRFAVRTALAAVAFAPT